MRYLYNYWELVADYRSITVAGFLSTLSSESSVLILALITRDRLISITKPLSHQQPTRRQASLHLILLWTTALTIASVPLMGGEYFGPEFYTSNGVCLPLHIHNPYTEVRHVPIACGFFCLIDCCLYQA